MTVAQRNAEILRILAQQTKLNTASQATARAALIAEGIYTKNGKLRVEYGGKSKKALTGA